MFNESVGARIKRLREEKKISASDLAAKIGVGRATVYRYENGEINKLSYTVLIPIAEALGTTPAYLLGAERNNFEELMRRIKMRFGDVEFSNDEMTDILRYVDFVLSKRKE